MASKPTQSRGRQQAAPPPRKPAPPAVSQRAAQTPPRSNPPARPQQASAPPANKTTAVAVQQQNTEMSTEFADAMSGYSEGRGLSQAADDNLVPLVRVLQKLSPQCEPRSAEHVEGAEAGMFWLKGMELVPGDEGLLAQPCSFSKWVTEWVPRDNGGGLVGRFEMQIGEKVTEALDRHGIVYQRVQDPKNPKRQKLVSGAGNDLIESREFACRIVMPDGRRLPFIVPMAGSNHSVGRGWMMMMNGKSVAGRRLDMFTSLYRLRTQYAENDQGNWYKYDVEDCGRLDQAQAAGLIQDWRYELTEGERLFNAFFSGEKQADTADYADERGPDTNAAGAGDGGKEDEIPF